MRGEVCVGSASFLAFASLLLLIFVHVSQINTSSVPRGISLVKVNVSDYGNALHNAIIDPIEGLYTTNSSAPLESGAGLRQFYLFGLYSYCGYVNDSAGTCSNHSIQNQFQPSNAITSDMLSNYTVLTNNILSQSGTPFADSSSLGRSSRAAYWMLLLGTICAALALLTGVAKNNFTFFVSTGFAIIGSIFILISASIWTAMIHKAQSINGVMIGIPAVPIGIEVTMGSALPMIWAAFATLTVSIAPYMISCCTFRG